MGSGRSLACPLLYLSGSGTALPVAAEEMRELGLLLLAPVPSGRPTPTPALLTPYSSAPQLPPPLGTSSQAKPLSCRRSSWPPEVPRGLSAAQTLAWGPLPSGGSTWEMPSVMPSASSGGAACPVLGPDVPEIWTLAPKVHFTRCDPLGIASAFPILT